MNTAKFVSARQALLPCVFVLAAVARAGHATAAPRDPRLTLAPDPTGLIGTLKVDSPIDRSGPFFQSLGTNGRSCGTCHDPNEAMSFTPGHARAQFDATRGCTERP